MIEYNDKILETYYGTRIHPVDEQMYCRLVRQVTDMRVRESQGYRIYVNGKHCKIKCTDLARESSWLIE